MNFIKSTYLQKRFFIAFAACMVLFVASYFIPFLFVVAQIVLIGLVLLIGVDVFLLFFRKHEIYAERKLPFALSMGDENRIEINFYSSRDSGYSVQFIDELPSQFQERNFFFKDQISEEKSYEYYLNPKERGEYSFGNIIAFLSSSIGFLSRKFVSNQAATVPVYPSIIAMKHFSLYSMQNVKEFYGVKRIRRIGQSYEFEQIKEYVLGDDLRNINWKATAKTGDLKVNHFQEEKSQQVYTIIDKSRAMNMPFDEMSLLDYAINASLVISNVSLQKQDKAGLITFSDVIGNTVKAQNDPGHISRIMQVLYKQKERNVEANYNLLYELTNKLIHGRSLLFLFTNVESQYSLERILPTLRRLNQRHILIVIFFKNKELEEYAHSPAENTKEIYLKTISEKMSFEKEQLCLTLNKYGIQTIYTEPENLTLNTVNKYLELKARGMI